jgi:peptidoglycan hydrolase-like protein with peptidoglycan-binding domain
MITKIRQALINACATIPPSDVFDDVMVTAVREFQQKQGLTPDGIIGPKTLSRLDVK